MGSDQRQDPPLQHPSLLGDPEEDRDVEQAFERVISSELDTDGSSVRALVPSEILKAGDGSLVELLTSALTEYEEIERVLDNLREHDAEPSTVVEDAVAVVTDDELADPEALARALAPLQSKTAQVEFLYARAKFGLERLDIYRLSRMSPERLLQVMRQETNHRTMKHLVQFLYALNRAADAFETLAIPPPHIRDYLRHLYSMADWDEMYRLVGVLETAMGGVREGGGQEPGIG